MALDPKLLLLDEPAAGMNAEESAELVSFVRQIRDRFDITILMIEHHMDVVSNLCDHVTVLNFGKTICVGTRRRSRAILRSSEPIWEENDHGIVGKSKT